MSDLYPQWFQRLIDVTYMKIGWLLVELLMFGVDGVMAPIPESQLLWVNKDVKSYEQSRKVPAAQASIINAHSQQQGRAARLIASQRALTEGSAAKAVVGWKTRGVSRVAQLPVVVPTEWSPVRSNVFASGSMADQSRRTRL
jgi:hypothetical protein